MGFFITLGFALAWYYSLPSKPESQNYENYQTALLASAAHAVCHEDPTSTECLSDGDALSIADIDGDGQVELVAVGWGLPASRESLGEVVTIWRYDPSARAMTLAASNWSGDGSFGALAVALADLDQDAVLEIITAGRHYWWDKDAAYLAVWRWSDGRLARVVNESWTVDAEDTVIEDVLVTDLDGDGAPEIVTLAHVKPVQGTYYAQIRTWRFVPENESLIPQTDSFLWNPAGDLRLLGASSVRTSGGTRLVAAGTAWSKGTGVYDHMDGVAFLMGMEAGQLRLLGNATIPDVSISAVSRDARPMSVGQDRYVLLAAGIRWTEGSIPGGSVFYDEAIVQAFLLNTTELKLGEQATLREGLERDEWVELTSVAVDPTGDLGSVTGLWYTVSPDGSTTPRRSFVRLLTLADGGIASGLVNEWFRTLPSGEELNDVAGSAVYNLDPLSAGPEVATVGRAGDFLEIRVWASAL